MQNSPTTLLIKVSSRFYNKTHHKVKRNVGTEPTRPNKIMPTLIDDKGVFNPNPVRKHQKNKKNIATKSKDGNGKTYK